MALSNTTQNTLRTSPYYDDYFQVANTETGLLRGQDFDFQRILFRPRYGVQSRELTQMQTLLQAQLERLGNAQFRDGDRVLGSQLTIDTEAISGQVLANTTLSSFFDRTYNTSTYVYARVSGAADLTTAARVTQYVSVDDGDTSNNYLVFKYTSSNSFVPSGVVQDSIDANSLAIFSSGSNTAIFHNASTISIDEGVMFVSGFFVRVRPQTIVLDALSNSPSYRVGMEIAEEVLDELDEVVGESIQDEANRGAVGAHRFRLRLTLAKRSIDDDANANFIEIARVLNGQILYTRANPRYVTADELRQTLARRTHDVSGDYIIRPFAPVFTGASTANSTNSEDVTTFQLSLAPGKAYVRGYEIETNAPVSLSIDKGRDTESANNRSIPASIGNYYLVSRVAGTTTPNNFFVGTSSVDVHCVPVANVDTTSNTTYNYSNIGVAKVRRLEVYNVPSDINIASFANSTVYKLFVYDWTFANTLTGNVSSATIDANGLIELTIAKANGIPLVNNAIEGATIVLGGADSAVSGTFTIAAYDYSGNDGKVRLKEYFSPLPNANTTYQLLFQPRDVDAFTLYDSTTANTYVAPFVNNFTFQADVATLGKINGTPDGYSIINGSESNKLVYQLPEIFIAANSIQANTAEFSTWVISAEGTSATGASNVSTTVVFSSGSQFSFPTGTLTPTDAREYLTFFNTTSATDGRGQTVEVAATSAAGANGTVRFISDISGTNVGNDYHLTFTYHHGSSVGSARTFKVLGKALVTGYPVRTKDYVVGNTTHAHSNTTAALTNGQVEYTSLNVSVNFAYSLKTHDVTNLRQVLYKSSNTASFANSDMSTATDVTAYFTLDTGQRDNTYDYGRAIVKRGASSAISSTGRLLFIFDHFMHSGIGYATVDSYLSTSNELLGMTYDTIPVYTSPKNGRKTNLRSVIDFRPAQGHYGASDGAIALIFPSSNTSTNTTYASSDGTPYLVPVSNDIWNGSYNYYLSRVDIVSLAANGEFFVTKGAPAIRPRRPHIAANDLLLHELNVPPYTLADSRGVPLSVGLQSFDYKRYTMQDIVKIDSRVQRLEYYTALSQLEQQTLRQTELDQDDNERYKNGIVVDNFVGTNTAAVEDPDFAASMDTRLQQLHPAFRSFVVQFTSNYANTTTSAITVVGDMAIPTYTTEEFIAQPLATKSVSVNPFDVGAFYGKVRLSPAVDTWKSTTTLPAQVIDGGGPTQAWINANLPAYTVWGEWQTTWTGYTNVPDAASSGGGDDENGASNNEGNTEWRVFGGADTKAGDSGWKSWEQWESAGSPLDSATGLPASST